MFQKRKRRFSEKLFWHDNNLYSTSKNAKRGNRYYLKDGKVNINRNYIICTNKDGNALEIHHWSRKKIRKPLYTIRYNESEIIVYDKRKRGYYIQYSPTEVNVFHRGKNTKRNTKADLK